MLLLSQWQQFRFEKPDKVQIEICQGISTKIYELATKAILTTRAMS